MKKTVVKLLVIALLMQIFLITNVYADDDDNFVIHAREGISVNAGESVEVPIIISNIRVNGVQKGVLGLSFKIEYNKNAFELEKFEDDSTFLRLAGNDDSSFNEEELIAVIICDDDKYLDQVTELGKVKLKAKEGLKTGYYDISITNIQGGNIDNTNMNISSPDVRTQIYVKGVEEEEQQDINPVESGDISGKTEEYTIFEDYDVSAKITQNQDGTELQVLIDEEKGMSVSKILIEDNEMKLENGVFTAKVEPNNAYTLKFYDENDLYITMKVVSVIDNTDDSTGTEDKKDDETDSKQNEDKKDDETDNQQNEDKKDNETDNQQTEDIEVDKTKDNNQNTQNIDKSAQTGDELVIVTSTLIISLLVFAILSVIVIKNKE